MVVCLRRTRYIYNLFLCYLFGSVGCAPVGAFSFQVLTNISFVQAGTGCVRPADNSNLGLCGCSRRMAH